MCGCDVVACMERPIVLHAGSCTGEHFAQWRQKGRDCLRECATSQARSGDTAPFTTGSNCSETHGRCQLSKEAGSARQSPRKRERVLVAPLRTT